MELRLKSGQRDLARVAMAMLAKKAGKAKKLLEQLVVSTTEIDALLSRSGMVVEAVGGHAELPVQLTFALRVTLRQGLAMFAEEVIGTRDDEEQLTIDTSGADAKLGEIQALAAMVSEQTSFADAVADEFASRKAGLEDSLGDGGTATLTFRGR